MRFILATAASLALAGSAFVLAGPAAAQSLEVPSGTYQIDPTHASITWKVSHLGYSTYTGMFGRGAISATITLDAEEVTNSKLEVTLDGQQVETLHPAAKDFNAEIESDMFLGTATQPEISFTTTAIEVTGANTANITGDLTLRGQTHPLTLATTLNRAAVHPMIGKPVLGVSATGVVKRSLYGVNGLLGPVGDDVTVEIQGEFVAS